VPGTGRTWRKIEMRADQTLHTLHLAIQDAFEFDDDHLYTFFMSGTAWDKRTEYRPPDFWLPGMTPTEEYESPVGDPRRSRAEAGKVVLHRLFGDNLDELRTRFNITDWTKFMEDFAGPVDALITKLEYLNLELGQKFLYLFDFGSEWRFTVRVHAINPDAPDNEYPRVVETVGEAPPQYPDLE